MCHLQRSSRWQGRGSEGRAGCRPAAGHLRRRAPACAPALQRQRLQHSQMFLNGMMWEGPSPGLTDEHLRQGSGRAGVSPPVRRWPPDCLALGTAAHAALTWHTAGHGLGPAASPECTPAGPGLQGDRCKARLSCDRISARTGAAATHTGRAAACQARAPACKHAGTPAHLSSLQASTCPGPLAAGPARPPGPPRRPKRVRASAAQGIVGPCEACDRPLRPGHGCTGAAPGSSRPRRPASPCPPSSTHLVLGAAAGAVDSHAFGALHFDLVSGGDAAVLDDVRPRRIPAQRKAGE